MMRIHLVIFIAQLELVTSSNNSYDKIITIDSFFILKQDTSTLLYKIERLLNKRIIKNKLYYLVK